MKTEWNRVGTVEIMRFRVYPIDPNAQHDPLGTTVCVEPGVYPLYRRFDAYCWIMTGQINERQAKLGDGLYEISQGDKPTGLEVQFPSRTYGPDEFADLLDSPVVKEGESQRLRILVERRQSDG